MNEHRSEASKPYPWYYAVNDRPVKVVRLENGGGDILVFDWTSGAFVPDRTYWEHVSKADPFKDVDELSEEAFAARVAELRVPIVERHLATAVAWHGTNDGHVPFRATRDGQTWTIRVNDFPAEPMYTLIIEGEEIADLDDWPAAWTMPASDSV